MINMKKDLIFTHNVNMYGFKCCIQMYCFFFLTTEDKATLNLLHQCMGTLFFFSFIINCLAIFPSEFTDNLQKFQNTALNSGLISW